MFMTNELTLPEVVQASDDMSGVMLQFDLPVEHTLERVLKIDVSQF